MARLVILPAALAMMSYLPFPGMAGTGKSRMTRAYEWLAEILASFEDSLPKKKKSSQTKGCAAASTGDKTTENHECLQGVFTVKGKFDARERGGRVSY